MWRVCAGVAGVLLSGVIAFGCTITLPVQVTSVTATLLPYNPAFASSGIPAEQVDFTVGGSPSGPVTCTISVWRSGTLVGTTTMGTNAGAGNQTSVQESVPVSIIGDTFAGSPSDAYVDCHLQ